MNPFIKPESIQEENERLRREIKRLRIVLDGLSEYHYELNHCMHCGRWLDCSSITGVWNEFCDVCESDQLIMKMYIKNQDIIKCICGSPMTMRLYERCENICDRCNHRIKHRCSFYCIHLHDHYDICYECAVDIRNDLIKTGLKEIYKRNLICLPKKFKIN